MRNIRCIISHRLVFTTANCCAEGKTLLFALIVRESKVKLYVENRFRARNLNIQTGNSWIIYKFPTIFITHENKSCCLLIPFVPFDSFMTSYCTVSDAQKKGHLVSPWCFSQQAEEITCWCKTNAQSEMLSDTHNTLLVLKLKLHKHTHTLHNFM